MELHLQLYCKLSCDLYVMTVLYNHTIYLPLVPKACLDGSRGNKTLNNLSGFITSVNGSQS